MRNHMQDPILPEEFGESFYQGEYEAIYQQMSAELRELVTFEQLKEMGDEFNQGVVKYVLGWKSSLLGIRQYVWLDDRREKAIAVSYDEDGVIAGLNMKPYVVFPETDRRYTSNVYRMPVEGEWYVFWGGANEFLNYHYPEKSQRYAYDLVKVEEGLTYEGDGAGNEQFFAYGKNIVAPADGKVVRVVDEVADNVPGEMNSEEPAGNFVIIEHQNHEYSMLAHLQPGSIKVQHGDRVKEGQWIGLCGNSGNSSEAHVHFQVMDKPNFEVTTSLRIRFTNGKEPIQGDTTSWPAKETLIQKVDKYDDAFELIDVLLFLPRMIAQFFKHS